MKFWKAGAAAAVIATIGLAPGLQPTMASGVSAGEPVSDALAPGESATPGMVIAWGANDRGQSSVPEAAWAGVTAIAAGGGHTLAVREGKVIAWGANDSGQSTVPEAAASGVTAIAAGDNHSLALKDGRVIAWGANWSGQASVPESALSGVVAIAAGGNQSLALKDGEVIAWGSMTEPPPESTKSGVLAIAAGSLHALAVSRFGEVIGWGRPGGQAGKVPEEARSGVSQVAAGLVPSLAVKDGGVIAWYASGALEKVPAELRSGVTAIAAGRGHSLALKDGKTYAWAESGRGGNSDGQMLVPEAATSRVLAVAAGYRHSVAIRAVSGVPSAPISVAATGGDASASVTWKMPPGSEPAGVFTVMASPGGSACSSTGLLTCTVTGLKNGTAYTFTVIARNALGASSASASSAPATPRGVAEAPGRPSAVAGNGAALVSWSAPASDGGNAVTGYTVAAMPGGRTCSTTGSMSCVVNDLDNGTAYTFAVRATNAAGYSEPSSDSPAVTPSAFVPTSPQAVRAVSGSGQVSVSWQPPSSEGGSPVVGYAVMASPGGRSCTTTGDLTCIVTGLVNGNAYSFTVTAANSAGTSVPSEATRPVTPAVPVVKPGPVSGLRATPGKGSVRFDWRAPADMGGSASVTYQYKLGRQPWTSTARTSLTMRGNRGVSISLSVRAVNSAGAGPISTVAAAPRSSMTIRKLQEFRERPAW